MSTNWRLNILAIVIAIGFLVLLSRLCYIQASSADPIRENFAQHETAFQTLPAWRGAINDAFNRPLATSRPVRTVSVYLPEFNPENAHEAATSLSPLVGVSVESLEQKLTASRTGQVVLAHDVDFDNAQMAALLRIPGIKFDQEFKRIYPGGSLACHLLGWSSRDEKSAEGLEFSWNECLKGTPGRRKWETTGRRQMLGTDGVESVDPVPGDTLTLTIDVAIQNILEEELATTVLRFAPKAASAVVMDPNTGDVLAAANYPNYDPNEFSDSIPDARRNRLITDVYEPGSTFKSFILSLALDQGAVTPSTLFDCEKGLWIVGKRHLHDAEPMGIQPLSDVLAHSSNIGAAKVALRWGNVTENDLLHSKDPGSRAKILNLATKMETGLTQFGFGEKSGIDLVGEVGGILHEPKDWTRDSLMSVAMGHEVGVTALQLADAYCAVVNGGHLLKPHVILRRTKADGTVDYERQVEVRANPISEATSQTMRGLLRGVVEHGTGAGCEYPGLLMAGKTGTAQKLNPDGTYSHDQYIGSFAGFAPYDHPELVVLVLLDSPDRSKGYYGAQVAAPAVQGVLRRSLGMRGDLTVEMVEKAKLEKQAAKLAAANAPAVFAAPAPAKPAPAKPTSSPAKPAIAPAKPAHAQH